MSYKRFVSRPAQSAKASGLEKKLRQLRKNRKNLRSSIGSAEEIILNRERSALPILERDGIF